MSEHVVMPRSDWQDILDAVREKAGITDLIKSGELAAIVGAISGGGSNPIATGTVVPTQDYYADDDYLVVNHNLGVKPNFYIFLHNGEDTLPSDATRGAIVVDVNYIYVVGEIYYQSKDGISFYSGMKSGYEDERNSQNFTVYAISSTGRRIVAGEEYIWICGVMGDEG